MSETENSETFQTFDDLNTEDFAEEAERDAEENWEKDEPGTKKEKVSEDLKVLDDSETDSEGKVIKKDKDKSKAEKEEDESEEEDEEESEESEEVEEKEKEKEEDKPQDKKESKKLRVRMGNELFNIDADATFKAKVDGELQDVTAQELINNWAGKVAYDKKFTELGKEKKALEFEKASIEKQRSSLLDHLNKAIEPLLDETKNPMDSLLYLVEMSGKDPYTAFRRLMEANLDETVSLIDMSETERELYFHKKKDELYSKVAKKRESVEKESLAFNQALERVNALRQSFNVSEDEFVEASEELESLYKGSGLDPKTLTDENIVDYASLKPHISKVRTLLEPFEENISEAKYGDVVANLSRHLRDGKVDEKELLKLIKQNFSVDEEVKELNSKVYSKTQGKESKKVKLKEESEKLETFDDWE